jgi:polyhydroxybutyrate depolymerase
MLLLLALLTACTSGGQTGSSESGSAPPSSVNDCSPARSGPAGTSQTLSFGGETRTYLLALPPTYDGTTAMPLVLDFHGFASNGPTLDADTELGAKGASRGYIVVTPSSDPPEWNEFGDPARADDYAFVHALVVSLEERLCIDPKRVFAAGHSNGSAFAGFLVCRPPFEIAAVAMVSATVPSTCPDDLVRSVLAIAGTADPQVPYAGGTVGGSTIAIPAVPDTIAAYVARYHCTAAPQQDAPVPGVDRIVYGGCAAGALVALATVVGGTHAWPGGIAAHADPNDSDAGHTFDASAAILDFFDRVGH